MVKEDNYGLMGLYMKYLKQPFIYNIFIYFYFQGYWLEDAAAGKGRLIHSDGDVYFGEVFNI